MLQQIFTLLPCDANWVAVVSWGLFTLFCKSQLCALLPNSPGGLVVKKCRRFAFDPWIGRSSGEENDYPFLPAVFLPGESHGQRNLAGYTPWGRKELDMTEQLSLHFSTLI